MALHVKNEVRGMEECQSMSDSPDTEPVVTAPSAETENTVPSAPTPTEPSEHMIPKSRLDDVLNRLKERDEELERFRKEAEERRQSELTEQERYKELYENEKAEREKRDRELEEERLTNLRQRIGAKYQLPERLISRLQGTTEAEIEADAEALSIELPKRHAPNINSERSDTSFTPSKKFRDMTYAEQEELYEKNPELFYKLANE